MHVVFQREEKNSDHNNECIWNNRRKKTIEERVRTYARTRNEVD